MPNQNTPRAPENQTFWGNPPKNNSCCLFSAYTLQYTGFPILVLMLTYKWENVKNATILQPPEVETF